MPSSKIPFCLFTIVLWKVSIFCLFGNLFSKIKESTTLLYYGNSMVERLLEHGEMEARMQIALPNQGLKIRSLAWTGDEVGNRLRLEGYPKHMKNLIQKWPADFLVLGYGMNEAFSGTEGLAAFKQGYRTHLKQLAKTHTGCRFILLSPTAAQKPVEKVNEDLELYSQAIAEISQKQKALFIDLLALTKNSVTKMELSNDANASSLKNCFRKS